MCAELGVAGLAKSRLCLHASRCMPGDDAAHQPASQVQYALICQPRSACACEGSLMQVTSSLAAHAPPPRQCVRAPEYGHRPKIAHEFYRRDNAFLVS